jgi:hypothetical protein
LLQRRPAPLTDLRDAPPLVILENNMKRFLAIICSMICTALVVHGGPTIEAVKLSLSNVKTNAGTVTTNSAYFQIPEGGWLEGVYVDLGVAAPLAPTCTVSIIEGLDLKSTPRITLATFTSVAADAYYPVRVPVVSPTGGAFTNSYAKIPLFSSDYSVLVSAPAMTNVSLDVYLYIEKP